MLGHTHAVIGLTVGMVAAQSAGLPPMQVLFIGCVSVLGALVPDIDHPASTIRRRLGVGGHVAFFWLGHRGITHTLMMLAAVSAATLYFLPSNVAFAFIFGYASHLLADVLTKSGVPLAYPLTNYRYSLRLMRTGGLAEALVWFICAGISSWIMWGFVA